MTTDNQCETDRSAINRVIAVTCLAWFGWVPVVAGDAVHRVLYDAARADAA